MEKEVIDPCNFFHKYDVLKGSLSTVVGHCRAATHGSINKKNAHPYHFGKIIGVHNGTISYMVPKDKELDRTDSSVLYEKINSQGLKSALEEARYGAYALAWIDVSANTLNFIRNDQRPLFFVRSKMNTHYWASERRMLEYMMSFDNTGYDEPWLLKPNCLFTFGLGGTANTAQDDFVPPPPKVFQGAKESFIKWCDTCRSAEKYCRCKKETAVPQIPFLPNPHRGKDLETKYLPKPDTPTYTRQIERYHMNDGTVTEYCNECWEFPDACECKTPLNPHVLENYYNKRKDEKIEEIIPPQTVDMYEGYNERQMSMKEAERHLNEGCVCCGGKAKTSETVLWTQIDEYFCSKQQCMEMFEQFYGPNQPKYYSSIVEIDV